MIFIFKSLLTQVFALLLTLQVEVAPNEGIASFYAEAFHGRQTASGIYFDMDGWSVAHKELPLGQKVLFVNWETLRFAVLRVEDRGPFIPDREWDFSKGAFDYLTDGDLDRGLVLVSYTVLPERDMDGILYPDN